MMDLRQAQNVSMVYGFWSSFTRWVLSSILVFVFGLKLLSGISHDQDVKVKTKVLTQQVAVPQLGVKDPIGSMTAEEFNSITIGMNFETVRRIFGYPAGNVAGDFKTFYPAAGGGRYIIHVSDSHYRLIVKSKEYVK